MRVPGVVRVIAWIVAGLLLLVIALYGVMVAINWSDEPPSVASQQLQRSIRDRPPVSDQDNAYVLLLGMGAPANEDPFARGQARMAFLSQVAPWKPGENFVEFPGKDINVKDARTPAITAMAEACLEGNDACVQQLRQHPDQVDHWLASEAWLLDRHLRLVQFRQWREAIPRDMGTPIASYQHAINGQQLLLVKAWRLAHDGEGDAARALLDQDLVFWRMVLRSSDTLISKMIASAAIGRHFALGSLVLRELHGTGKRSAPPDAWTTPITLAERSMYRAMAGEARYLDASLRPSLDHGDFPGGRVGQWLLRPMIKPQATSNLYATRMTRLAGRMDADYRAMPQEVRDAAESEPENFLRAYNPIGYILFRITTESDYMDYAVRLTDLEGQRRAALLAEELRDANADAANAARLIQSSTLRNPYTEQSFEWDPAMQSVVFKGLATGKRASHAVLL